MLIVLKWPAGTFITKEVIYNPMNDDLYFYEEGLNY